MRARRASAAELGLWRQATPTQKASPAPGCGGEFRPKCVLPCLDLGTENVQGAAVKAQLGLPAPVVVESAS
jgi:hypothetical protein